MGKKSKKKKQIAAKEEEIDLVKLFSLIGNAFSRFFIFIWSALKGIFHYLILIILFFKSHLLKFIVALVIGLSIGFSRDYVAPDRYVYDMIIQPNYQSVSQIYEKMEYYNVLIREGDTIQLAKEFNITPNSASKLYEFELIPYETEKDKILAYDAFIKRTDTLTQRYFSFATFLGEGTSKFDSNKYVYRVKSFQYDLKSLEKKIIFDIEDNPTLQKRKRIRLSTLKLDSTATKTSLRDIDSLRAIYKTITLSKIDDNKTLSSTYIDFSKESKTNNDIKLFDITRELNDNLINIEVQKEASENIINIITRFNPAGKKIGVFYETNMFKFGRFFTLSMLAFLILREINRYLVSYKNNKPL